MKLALIFTMTENGDHNDGPELLMADLSQQMKNLDSDLEELSPAIALIHLVEIYEIIVRSRIVFMECMSMHLTTFESLRSDQQQRGKIIDLIDQNFSKLAFDDPNMLKDSRANIKVIDDEIHKHYQNLTQMVLMGKRAIKDPESSYTFDQFEQDMMKTLSRSRRLLESLKMYRTVLIGILEDSHLLQ